MARIIQYQYKKQHKEILFSFQQYHTIHEAVAAEEGLNIEEYLKMEQQIHAISDAKAVKDYRDNYFKKLGFGQIRLKPKLNKPIGSSN